MPWIVLFVSGIYKKQTRESWQSSPGLFILCWAIFPFLFFSFSQSKLPGYILPSIPPMFLLLSRALDRLFLADRNISAVVVGITGAMFPVLVLSLEVIVMRVGHSFNIPSSRVIALLVLAGTGGLISVGFSLRKRLVAGLTTIVLLIVAILIFMNIEILPFADSRISARAAAMESFRLIPSPQDVAVSELKRDWHYGLNYYFGRDLPEWTPGEPLPEWLFTNEKNAIELRRLGDRIHEVSRAGAPLVVLIHVSPENPSRR
jgi:4-amino-4-deoxy-L-arabinose transferase-like glycosyltransferase